MKKFLTLLALVLCALVASAQKENISYSLVIRDANGDLVADKDVKIKVELLFGRPAADPNSVPAAVLPNHTYGETHDVKTDKNGIATILIGAGEVISSNYFKALKDFPFSGTNRMNVEIDPDGKGYSIKGSSLLTSVPSAMNALTADKATTAGNVTSLGDMPMTKLNVVVDDAYGVATVSFLGRSLKNGTSPDLSVPAYSPVFLSVNLKEFEKIVDQTNKYVYTYTVTVNDVPFDNFAGTYEKANKDVVNSFTTEEYDVNLEWARNGSEALITPYSSRNNSFYHNRGGNSHMILCRVLDNLVDYNEGTRPNEFRSNEFVSPLNIAMSQHSDIYMNLAMDWSEASGRGLGFKLSNGSDYCFTPVLTHSPAEKQTYISPIYAEVPNFIYMNSFTTETSYKVGTHPTELDANMVNQVVGPFDKSTNTIKITVKKEHRTTVN